MLEFVDMAKCCNVLGIGTVLLLAWMCSVKPRHVNIPLIIKSFVILVGTALLMLKTDVGGWVMQRVADGVSGLYSAANKGIEFIFGSLAKAEQPWGFIFAFQVLPIIIFFGAFMSVLYHFGIIQRVMRHINQLLQPILGTSGAETLCAASNSFLGQTEAPLLIKNYLKKMRWKIWMWLYDLRLQLRIYRMPLLRDNKKPF